MFKIITTLTMFLMGLLAQAQVAGHSELKGLTFKNAATESLKK